MGTHLDKSKNNEAIKAIGARIRKVVVQSLGLNISEGDMVQGTKLDEYFGLDSVAALEFVAGLEQEFGILIDPERLELNFLRDLDRVAVYIAERTSAGPGRS